MKFVVSLLAILAFTNGYEFQEILSRKDRSISSQIVELIETAKIQMPCGFPSLGIPPLSPLKLEHEEIKTNGDNLDLELLLDNLKLYGLDNFDIIEFKINTILSKITFKFHWHHVYMKTLYDILLRMDNNNLFSKFLRNGNAIIGMQDFIVWGTCKYSLGLIGNGGLRLKEFNLYAEVDNVNSEIENLSNITIVNRKINEIVEELIMLTINENTDNIERISNEYVMPVINDLIGDRTLGDLISIIVGNDDPNEKETCIPPTDEDEIR